MTLEARLKRLGGHWQHTELAVRTGYGSEPAFRAVCGRPLPCPGLIGNVYRSGGGWKLRSPLGYHRPDDQGFYRIFVFKQARRPRRPMASDIPENEVRHMHSTNSNGDVWRGLKGQEPVLPAVIYCPVCSLPNRVGVPAI